MCHIFWPFCRNVPATILGFKGPSQPHLCFCLHVRVWLLYFIRSMSKRRKSLRLLKIIKHTFRKTTYCNNIQISLHHALSIISMADQGPLKYTFNFTWTCVYHFILRVFLSWCFSYSLVRNTCPLFKSSLRPFFLELLKNRIAKQLVVPCTILVTSVGTVHGRWLHILS